MLRRAVGAARLKARTILTERMAQRLSSPMRERLDALLDVGEEYPYSPLNRITSAPVESVDHRHEAVGFEVETH